MKQYLDMMRLVRETGVFKQDRTGTGTYSIFAHQMRFDLSDGFPLVTTKRTHLKSIIHELLWFLQGSTNIRYLKENGVKIWDEWVLDGTAEYIPMSMSEIQVALVKHFKSTDFTPVYSEELIGSEYQIVRDEDDESRIVFEYAGDDSWTRAFEDIIGYPSEKLIAGELGPVYGSQWRSWPDPKPMRDTLEHIASLPSVEQDECTQYAKEGLESHGIDQIAILIDQLTRNPDSRRLIVSAWNPAEVDRMALPPCHCLFQFYTAPLSGMERWKLMDAKGIYISFCTEPSEAELHRIADEKGIPSRKLSCQLYQRSCDVFLGVPFNIASYALLTMMLAQTSNMVPGEFIWTGGDIHIYSNHLEQVDLQLTRTPHALPKMKINPDVKDLFGFTIDDFELVDYVHDAAISAPIAV